MLFLFSTALTVKVVGLNDANVNKLHSLRAKQALEGCNYA